MDSVLIWTLHLDFELISHSKHEKIIFECLNECVAATNLTIFEKFGLNLAWSCEIILWHCSG